MLQADDVMTLLMLYGVIQVGFGSEVHVTDAWTGHVSTATGTLTIEIQSHFAEVVLLSSSGQILSN